MALNRVGLTIATICARGGSQGLPGKNVRPFAGIPLIAHTIAHAIACSEIDRVFVSTDDPEIAGAAKEAGAQVPFARPAELATAEIGKLPVITHLVEHVEADGMTIDRVVDLQPTSPLRTVADIEGCLGLLDSGTDCVVTACTSPANPYYNLVEPDVDGFLQLSKRTTGPLVARQEAPEVFMVTGSVYCWHRRTLEKGVLGGRTRYLIVPRERAVDIDDILDFRLAELLYAETFPR